MTETRIWCSRTAAKSFSCQVTAAANFDRHREFSALIPSRSPLQTTTWTVTWTFLLVSMAKRNLAPSRSLTTTPITGRRTACFETTATCNSRKSPARSDWMKTIDAGPLRLVGKTTTTMEMSTSMLPTTSAAIVFIAIAVVGLSMSLEPQVLKTRRLACPSVGADVNRDGWMDVYVGNMFSTAGNRITFQGKFHPTANADTKAKFQRLARGNTLFVNTAHGPFEDRSLDAAVNMGRWAWGSMFVDVNNDGWDDLVVANGNITNVNPKDL